MLLVCSLNADELRLKHSNALSDPAKAEALLATHLQAFSQPQFAEDSLRFLLKQGVSAANASRDLASVTILYEPRSGELLLRSANKKALNAVADAVIYTGLGIYFDAVAAPILAAEEKGDHALAERLKNEMYPGPASIHWWVDRSAETNASAQTTESAAAHSAAPDTLLLRHHTDADQMDNPQIVEMTLARQIASFGSERFRQDSIEALAQNGLTPESAAQGFDAITLYYNIKTRDLYLSGADEPTLRAIASGSLRVNSVRTGIDVFVNITEDARERGDTATLEKLGSGTRLGGHASLWSIVGMVADTAP